MDQQDLILIVCEFYCIFIIENQRYNVYVLDKKVTVSNT